MITIEYKTNRVPASAPYKALARFSSKGDAESALQALRQITRGFFFRIAVPPAPAAAPAAQPQTLSPGDLTIEELGARVAEISDRAVLEELRVLEEAGKARKGALAAIEARLGELA